MIPIIAQEMVLDVFMVIGKHQVKTKFINDGDYKYDNRKRFI